MSENTIPYGLYGLRKLAKDIYDYVGLWSVLKGGTEAEWGVSCKDRGSLKDTLFRLANEIEQEMGALCPTGNVALKLFCADLLKIVNHDARYDADEALEVIKRLVAQGYERAGKGKDGIKILPGDIVYIDTPTLRGKPFTVVISDDDHVRVLSQDGAPYGLCPDELTHTKPDDSWERLECDMEASVYKYAPYGDEIIGFIQRAKALANQGADDEHE
ncbi:hypothetical protein K6V98_08230 [Collinsella sp. AGMB00827]|uniref:Uncharacterized protein n=1 Tax=Collinsella ureilytica TaxID=2869515 RepID=A0ABS7MLU4_9ACTN|nr:hypothetical protein [Collinsella urealyticum]MBY4798331.1 hypothetical protein [Collinsella urealyticum]